MWLITTFISALIATLLWFLLKKKYNLRLLSLMLWGATIMILTDHILGYEGGNFIETQTDGIIHNGTLLGIVMLIPIFLIYLVTFSVSRFRQK